MKCLRAKSSKIIQHLGCVVINEVPQQHRGPTPTTSDAYLSAFFIKAIYFVLWVYSKDGHFHVLNLRMLAMFSLCAYKRREGGATKEFVGAMSPGRASRHRGHEMRF